MLARQVRLSPLVPVIGGRPLPHAPTLGVRRAACFSLEKRDPVGKVYEIGGPEALSYNEMIDTLCQVMGNVGSKAPHPRDPGEAGGLAQSTADAQTVAHRRPAEHAARRQWLRHHGNAPGSWDWNR